jgi:hypothetical protein
VKSVPKHTTVTARFPEHELAVRRLFICDADFRAICEDHEEAIQALLYWQAKGTSQHARAEEYRQLVSELEAEIATTLAKVPKTHSDSEQN